MNSIFAVNKANNGTLFYYFYNYKRKTSNMRKKSIVKTKMNQNELYLFFYETLLI